MPEQQSELSPYQSRFGGGFISKGQWLAENMVSRSARKKGVDLPFKFWTLDKWKREFLLQKRYADSLLKVYSVEAIVRALRTKKGQAVYSLGAKFLDPLIKDEQEKIDRQEKAKPVEQEKQEQPAAPTTSRDTVFTQPSTLGKLRGM